MPDALDDHHSFKSLLFCFVFDYFTLIELALYSISSKLLQINFFFVKAYLYILRESEPVGSTEPDMGLDLTSCEIMM